LFRGGCRGIFEPYKHIPTTLSNRRYAMAEKYIYLRREDYEELSRIVRAVKNSSGRFSAYAKALSVELEKAVIVQSLPDDVVSIGSVVEFTDLETGETGNYAVVFPSQADISAMKVSVLAPLGSALIGEKSGDEVSYDAPGGRKRIRVGKVTARAVET